MVRCRMGAAPVVCCILHPFHQFRRVQGPKETKEKSARPRARRWIEAKLSYAMAFSTTVLRQGFSTAIASSEARMLAPAAMMNTLSQLPDDCCM
jgi:hypothetical protein